MKYEWIFKKYVQYHSFTDLFKNCSVFHWPPTLMADQLMWLILTTEAFIFEEITFYSRLCLKTVNHKPMCLQIVDPCYVLNGWEINEAFICEGLWCRKQRTHRYIYKKKHKKCNTLHWSWLLQTFTICAIKILYWQTHELQLSQLKWLLPRMQQSHFVHLPSCHAQKVCSPFFVCGCMNVLAVLRGCIYGLNQNENPVIIIAPSGWWNGCPQNISDVDSKVLNQCEVLRNSRDGLHQTSWRETSHFQYLQFKTSPVL